MMDEHVEKVLSLLDRPDDYKLAHELMAEELKTLEALSMGCTRTVHTVCRSLSMEGLRENIWLIWRAKNSNQDTYCSIDMTWLYLCFDLAGTTEDVEDYVRRSGHPERVDLLERIEQDKRGWLTPEKFAQLSREHFKVSKSFILYG